MRDWLGTGVDNAGDGTVYDKVVCASGVFRLVEVFGGTCGKELTKGIIGGLVFTSNTNRSFPGKGGSRGLGQNFICGWVIEVS
jgi:hypothetical protein